MLRFLAGAFLDLLLPPSCAICNELLDDPKSVICQECRFSFDEIVPPICSVCGQPLVAKDSDLCPSCRLHRPMVKKIRSAFMFGGGVQQAVLAMKLSRRSELAQYLARQAMSVSIPDWNWSHVDLIVPVPLHGKRLRTRMFDQAALIASSLGKLTQTPVKLSIMRRQRNTPAQARMALGKNRRKNVENAFRVVKPTLVRKKTICLVDDVVTTGATLDECARVLLEAGAKEVTSFTVARTILE